MAKTNSSIQTFSFAENITVRSMLDENNQPWFIAADVCEALELKVTARVVSRLDEDEKGVHTVNTLGGKQELTTINESGLYSLILTSRKAEAKRFKKWVTAEVLPAIRKTGSYQQSAQAEKPLALPDHTRRHVWVAFDSTGKVCEHVELNSTDAVRSQVDKHFPATTLLEREAVIEDLDHVADLLSEMTARVRNTLNPLITALGTPTNATPADADAFWNKRRNRSFQRLAATVGGAV